MSQNHRYAQETRAQTLELYFGLSIEDLRRLLDWLVDIGPDRFYRFAAEVREAAINYLKAPPSGRARRKLRDIDRLALTAAAMWYGHLAFKWLQEHPSANGAGLPSRQMTGLGAICGYLRYGANPDEWQRVFPIESNEALLEEIGPGFRSWRSCIACS